MSDYKKKKRIEDGFTGQRKFVLPRKSNICFGFIYGETKVLNFFLSFLSV
ncbi:MAG: hypothetical protein JWR38_4163 [Mucilaginibacter sp.]|nr:hypothetical protein [Mucilaginibacter sp.]